MVWPILISVSVTPGAFSAAADIAIAPLSKLPNKIRNISHPALFENPATSARIQGADRKQRDGPNKQGQYAHDRLPCRSIYSILLLDPEGRSAGTPFL